MFVLEIILFSWSGVVSIQRFMVSVITVGLLSHWSSTLSCKLGWIFAKNNHDAFLLLSWIIGLKLSKTPKSVKRVSLSSPLSWYFPPHLKVPPSFFSISSIFSEKFSKILKPFCGKSFPTIPTGMVSPNRPEAMVA